MTIDFPTPAARPYKLRALAVDDEPPALDELAYLLRADDRVDDVQTAANAEEVIRILDFSNFDVVFLDIRMPGLDGFDLARQLWSRDRKPSVVFITAHDDRAVDAFELGAVDYLLKPLLPCRLGETLRRVSSARNLYQDETSRQRIAYDVIPVELAGRIRMLHRAAIRWVEAKGDYARLHTSEGSHLVRIPLSLLEERWADAGFVRIHRSYLVAIQLIQELRLTGRGYVVRVDHRELPVSRRHTRELKDRLVRAARQQWSRS